MTQSKFSRTLLGTAAAALMAASLTVTASAPASAQSRETVPANEVTLSVGAGRMIRLDGSMSDVFIANPAVADVQVRSANQLYIFGKAPGATTIYATNRAGRVIYSANVQVGNNIETVGEMLSAALPDANIQVTPMNGVVLLTGAVASPADIEDATRLAQAYVGEGTPVISRLKTATPLQVMLQVKIAEVSRSVLKDVGVNLLTRDTSGGFLFGIGRGNAGTITDGPGGTEFRFNNPAGATTLGLAGRVLGLDILSTINLAETSGLASTLAEPTLVALSGETASFLAGGEFPIPTAQGINGTSVEFKEFGVSLAFTPTVLDGGRISMRVRPEVSDISSEGAVKLDGFEIPSLTTRRTETTVELGSGQSFMIAGLLRNSGNTSVDRAPFLGNLPILGALFRSNGFRRNQTELVIVVTPYLVKPVNARDIALPTDGFRTASDPERILADRMHNSRNEDRRPVPTMAPPRTVTPSITPADMPAPPTAQAQPPAGQAPAARPGFRF